MSGLLAVKELLAAAQALLPAKCAEVATEYAVDLPAPGTYQDWWRERADLDRGAYPVCAVLWDRTRTGLRVPSAGNVRKGEHPLVVLIAQSGTVAEVGARILYYAEALLRFLDDAPTSRTDATKVIWRIGGAGEQEIELSHDIELMRSDKSCIWVLSADVPVATRHTPPAS